MTEMKSRLSPKCKIQPLLNAMTNFSNSNVLDELKLLFKPSALIRMCYPFGDLDGPIAWYHTTYRALYAALPDLERRDMIILSGQTTEGNHWVGCMGNYVGTFILPFLDIPPTGHFAHMRFHEFFKFEGEKVVEVQAIWDLPELMMLANAWPMSPQLGAFLFTPGPMTGDGLFVSGYAEDNIKKVKDMLSDLCRHPTDPDPKVMKLEKHWHPSFNWYGPAGIGTGRGITGFRAWHQIPFLRGMPDREVDKNSDCNSGWSANTHWIGEGNYVCETGWPNMRMKLSSDGWLGIAPVEKEIFLRSLDFWRLDEMGLIRENWVLVDLLDMYSQIGIAVFDRLKEFNKARNLGQLSILESL